MKISNSTKIMALALTTAAVVLTAIAWIGCGSDDDERRFSVVNGKGARNIAIPTYTLTTNATPAGGGSVTRSPDLASYTTGAKVNVCAAPASDYYEFTGWTEASTSKEHCVTVTMDGDKALTAGFQLKKYNLTVNQNLAGGGTTTPTGTSTHNAGTTVDVCAAPENNYEFAGWTEAVTSEERCVPVTMDGNKKLTANFKSIAPTLTVKANPAHGGSVTPSGAMTRNVGDDVTVRATPEPCFEFAGWSGASSSKNATITITMNGDQELTASFQRTNNTLTTYVKPINAGEVQVQPIQVAANSQQWAPYTLTNDIIPINTNQVSHSPNETILYPCGVELHIMAKETNDQYEFGGWEGAITSTNPTVMLTMNDNLTVGAIFREKGRQLLLVEIDPPSGGEVTRNPDEASYIRGTQVAVTATPKDGYDFTGWTGNVTSGNRTATVTMNSDLTLKANFRQKTYTLSACTGNQPTGGKVTCDPKSNSPDQSPGVYTHGTQVTVTAEPSEPCHTFDKWSEASTSTNRSVTITMDGDKKLTPIFQQKAFTLTANASPTVGGTVTRNPNQTNYVCGTSVTVTADSTPNYRFVGWSGASTSTNRSVTITIDANKTITAIFEPVGCAFIAQAGGGMVSYDPSVYTHGTQITAKATPDSCHTFIGWSGASTSTSNPVTIAVDCGKKLTPVFQQKTFTLTANPSPTGGGTVTRSPSLANYACGTQATVTARASAGYRFTGWSGASTSADTSVTVNMDGNKTLTANFQQTYTVTYNINGGTGTMPAAQTVNAGSSIILPDNSTFSRNGFAFGGWNTNSFGTGINYDVGVSFTPTRDTTLYAKWKVLYTLVINPSPTTGGVVSRNPDKTSYTADESIIIVATALSGYGFFNWTVAPSGAATFTNANNASTTITLNSNATIFANFQPLVTLTVNRNPTAGGTVSPTSLSNIIAGTPVNISATEASGYRFVNWMVTSGSATFANVNYKTTTVTLYSNATISANFETINFTDSRDNRVYRTVRIGNLRWMAENLNFTVSNNSWCYSNTTSNCTKYGRLYTWDAAMSACPPGWHVPSRAEWTALVDHAGDSFTAGSKLRSSTGWNAYSGISSTDEFGFSALPGGHRTGSSFNNVGYLGLWWSATESGSSAYYRSMAYDYVNVFEYTGDKGYGFSLRCRQD